MIHTSKIRKDAFKWLIYHLSGHYRLRAQTLQLRVETRVPGARNRPPRGGLWELCRASRKTNSKHSGEVKSKMHKNKDHLKGNISKRKTTPWMQHQARDHRKRARKWLNRRLRRLKTHNSEITTTSPKASCGQWMLERFQVMSVPMDLLKALQARKRRRWGPTKPSWRRALASTTRASSTWWSPSQSKI